MLKHSVLPLLMFAFVIDGASAQMYRSVDAGGKVIYTDTPPAGDSSNGKTVRVAPRPPPAWTSPNNTDVGQELPRPPDVAESRRKEAALAKAAADKACRDAYLVMKSLEFAEGKRIARRLPNGEYDYVSDEDRDTVAAVTRQKIARYCR